MQPVVNRNNPDLTWSTIRSSQNFMKIPMKSCQSYSYNPKKVTRVACMSDTHGRHRSVFVPNYDILIHGGDFTKSGEIKIIKDLSDYFGTLRTRSANSAGIICCIAGNHDITFQPETYQDVWKTFHPRTGPISTTVARESLQNCIYLEDESLEYSKYVISDYDTNADMKKSPNDENIQTDCDAMHQQNKKHLPKIKIYGSPWTPTFGYNWAFNQDRDTIHEKWQKIPQDTDILVTHGPPLGRKDKCSTNTRAGCYDLLQIVQNHVKPRVHIFGHIHEDYGCSYDGKTLYINASSVNLQYRPKHECIVFDLPHSNYDTDENENEIYNDNDDIGSTGAFIVKPFCNFTSTEIITWLRENKYELILPFFEEKKPQFVGTNLVVTDDDEFEFDDDFYYRIGCELNMHRERNWRELVQQLECAILHLRCISYS